MCLILNDGLAWMKISYNIREKARVAAKLGHYLRKTQHFQLRLSRRISCATKRQRVLVFVYKRFVVFRAVNHLLVEGVPVVN